MGIGVQREAGVGMPQNPRQGLGIHADGQSNRLRFPINNKKSEYPEGYSNHPRIMKRPVKAGNTGALQAADKSLLSEMVRSRQF